MAQQPIPVKEFRSWDYSRPHSLTCKNHTELRWYWKGPGRNLHFSFTSAASNNWEECKCPISDLLVIVQPEDKEWQAENV